jgi:hypothetical protein
VKVKHRLAGDLSIVREDVVSFKIQTNNDGAGNDLGCIQNVMKIVFRNGKKIKAMLLWNYESVAEVYRVNVENGNNLVVLEEDLGRKLSLNDPAEDAIHGSYPCVPKH